MYEVVVRNIKVGKLGHGAPAPRVETHSVRGSFDLLAARTWKIDLGIADFALPDFSRPNELVADSDACEALVGTKQYCSSDVCCVCLEGAPSMLFLPCRHRVCCRECTVDPDRGTLRMRTCPACRAELSIVLVQ